MKWGRAVRRVLWENKVALTILIGGWWVIWVLFALGVFPVPAVDEWMDTPLLEMDIADLLLAVIILYVVTTAWRTK